MHPILAETIAQEHARRIEQHGAAHRARLAARARRARRRHSVRGRSAAALVRLAARLDPPTVQDRRPAAPC